MWFSINKALYDLIKQCYRGNVLSWNEKMCLPAPPLTLFLCVTTDKSFKLLALHELTIVNLLGEKGHLSFPLLRTKWNLTQRTGLARNLLQIFFPYHPRIVWDPPPVFGPWFTRERRSGLANVDVSLWKDFLAASGHIADPRLWELWGTQCSEPLPPWVLTTFLEWYPEPRKLTSYGHATLNSLPVLVKYSPILL